MARKTSGERKKGITGGSSSEPSPAMEFISSNIDLLTEILLRLPAKSLVRFKCVSKHWLSLISDSHFASSHARLRLRRRISISALYVYWSTNHFSDQPESISLQGGDHSHPTLSFLDGVGGDEETRITHSCNGLILCEYYHFDHSFYPTTRYVVCNLTTQKYRLIPDSLPGQLSTLACLAFEPSKSPHYNVVLLDFDRVDIYSSESGCWKQICAPGSHFDVLRRAVFWDGAIHWLSDRTGDTVLLRFDMGAEKMITMRNPPSPKILPMDKIRYFGECGGHLILIQTHLRSAMGFRILEMDMDMDMDYCRWIVNCRVNLRPVISEMESRIRKFDQFSVLCVVKGEEGKYFELVLAILGRVISYDLKRKTGKVLRESTSYGGPQAYQFIASLHHV